MFTPLLFYLWNEQVPANGGNQNVLSIRLREIGSTFTLSFTYLTSYGWPADPIEPSISIIFPDETQFSATPERVSTGIYTYNVTTPFVGNYYYTFNAL